MDKSLLRLFVFFSLLLLIFISSTKSVSPNHEIIPPQSPKKVEQGEASSVQAPNPRADLQASEIVEHSEYNFGRDTPDRANPQTSNSADNNGMKEEMAVVGDNISAFYIVRKITRRAKALIASKTAAIDKMQKKGLIGSSSKKIMALEEELDEAEILLSQANRAEIVFDNPPTAEQLAENATRSKDFKPKKKAVKELEKKLAEATKNTQKDKRENMNKMLFDFWVEKLKESKLPYKNIKDLNDQLADALKEEKNVENYLEHVNAHIDIFRDQQRIAKEREEKKPDMEGYKICHQLCAEHLNFLEQIRLEVQLHYEFKFKPDIEPHHDSKNKGLPASSVLSDFQAFMENAKNLEKPKENNLHGKAQAEKKPNWWKKQINCFFPEKDSKKVVVETMELASYYAEPKTDLLQLNNAVNNLYMEIAKVIEWPFINEQTFVGSIVDVAKMVKQWEGGKDLYKIDPDDQPEIGLHEHGGVEKAYKNYLENLFNMYEAAQSILINLPRKWKTEIYGQIHGKLEMPREWYSTIHADAYPKIQEGDYELTEEMVHLRVELLLTKTLLVFERLDNFYNIDDNYKMWKKQNPNSNIHLGSDAIKKFGELIDGRRLLKTYFEEFKKKKQAAPPVVTFPVAHGHGEHASTSKHG